MMADRAARRPERLELRDAPRLYVELHGRGPTLLLGHGFGGSARNFGPQARALRDAWRVVLFDARGHARSEAPEDPQAYTPECLSLDLGRILDALPEERAVVGGLSMGAGLALRFALRHPERVRALVLAAFPPSARAPGQTEWALGFADAIEREGLEAAGARYVWGPRSGFDAATARFVRQGFLEHAPHALVHILRRVIATQPDPDELAPELATLRVPALVVAGSRDRLSGSVSRRLARHLPGAEWVEIEGAGHVVNLAAPGPFNAALRSFLERLER